MQRFVYTPRLHVFIHHEETQQVIDVSDDVISGSVTRRLNAVSTAEIVLQNKQGKYLRPSTAEFLFAPMDRIVIYMSRLGKPMPVFSGFLDETPYYHLYPAPVTIKASDALKLLQYTYFDPGVPAMTQLFLKHNWIFDPSTGQLTGEAGTFGNFDVKGGMADVLTDVITTIGGWSADRVKFQELPPKFINNITKAMQKDIKEQSDEYAKIFDRLTRLLSITNADQLNNTQTTISGTTITPATGNISGQQVAQLALDSGLPSSQLVTAVAIAKAESSWQTNAQNYNTDGSYDFGLWQINTVHRGSYTVNEFKSRMFDPKLNAQQMYLISSGGTNWTPWVTYNKGAYRQYLGDAQDAVQKMALANGGQQIPGTSAGDTTVTQSGSQGTTPTTVPRTKPNSDSIATKVVQIAVSEGNKGIVEQGGQNQGPEILKYQQYVGLTPGPSAQWCAAFVSWVFGQAGDPNVRSSLVSDLVALGSPTNNPQPADLVHWDDHHVGIVTTRQGNTVGYVAGNEADGVRPGSVQIGQAATFVHIPGLGAASTGAATSQLDPAGGATGQGGISTPEQIAQIAKQSAWFTLQFQGSDIVASEQLTGKRALSNDISLLDWFTSIIPASGRSYMATPDGSFLAFYPDYFGYYGRSPYFRIADIEITELEIQRNDQNLTTHVFGTGPFLDMQINTYARELSQIASIEDTETFRAFVNVPIDDPRTNVNEGLDVSAFMKRYGARPYQYDLPDVRNPVLVWMATWMKFAQLWSQQFTANATFTFLPEVIPGGLVAFGDRISMFVEEVTHSFDRTSGFSTSATLSSPAAIDDKRFPWLPESQVTNTGSVSRSTSTSSASA